MVSKKSRDRNKPRRTPNRRRRKLAIPLVIALCVGIAVAGYLLLSNRLATESDRSGQLSTSASGPEGYQRLIGRWLRPDGGYVIEIRSVETDGTLQAAYFNPRPINVSQARAFQKDGKPRVFIELRDAGYPGATYDLTYNAQQDMLTGVYFQPAVRQSFDVVFVRTQ